MSISTRSDDQNVNPVPMKCSQCGLVHGLESPYTDGCIRALKDRVAELEAEKVADVESINIGSPLENHVNAMVRTVHTLNRNWWVDIETQKPKERNKGELIALMHSELSEALEGERRGLMDDHLPHRRMAEVEMADTVIRILDYCGGFKYDLGGAMREKLLYNMKRADHKREARLQADGKKF